MKKFSASKTVLASLAALSIASAAFPAPALADDGAVNVVTTIFPIYDWVREIAGPDSNLVNLTMLMDTGVDLHSFQPAVQDIIRINTADVFIYVGGESDGWVKDTLATANNPNLTAISLVEAMGEDIKIEEIVEGMEHEHDHEEGEDHDHEEGEDHDHEEGEDHDHEHEAEADEHVWLSLRNAEKLVAVIAGALSESDPDNAAVYQANASAYIEKLAALDREYQEVVGSATYHTLLFGDRFPFRYLVDDYGLDYYAAFSGCSAEAEASFQTIVFLAQKVDELSLPAVLTIENPQFKIAETIVSNTKAKNQQILSMNSLQGITSSDVNAGITYLSIMEDNLNILKEALK